MSDVFVYSWVYEVSLETVDEFCELYGPSGAWEALFRRAPGYLGTELLRDRANPLRFMTIDRWESEEAIMDFRARFAEEFEHLDLLGERLTLSETSLGEFVPAGKAAPPT